MLEVLSHIFINLLLELKNVAEYAIGIYLKILVKGKNISRGVTIIVEVNDTSNFLIL